MITNNRPRPLRRNRLNQPIPFVPTCKGMGLPWPSANAENVPTPAQDTPAPPAPFVCPADIPPSMFCTVCGIANLYGPSCFGDDCPRRITR